MKQAQFRRSAQSPGFRPIQVSNANISRMREESDRVIQGMRNVRDAEIKNRERVLSEVKENQRAEAAARERNFQINTKNQQTALNNLQLEARARQQQIASDQQATASILKSISNISETAGEIYGTYVEVKEDEQINKALLDFENSSEQQQELIKTILGESYVDELEEQRQSTIDSAEAEGTIDRVTASKARNYSPRVDREIKKGKLTWFYNNKYGLLLEQQLELKRQEKGGAALTSSEAAAVMEDFKEEAFTRIRSETGIALKPATMRTSLEIINKIHQSKLSKIRADEVKLNKQLSIDNETKIISQNPGEFSTNIIPSFTAVARANDYDYAKAHEWLQNRALEQRADGSFIVPLEELANIVLPGDKKPYAEARPGRYGEIVRQRTRLDNTYRQTQITTDNLAYREAELNYRKGFTENPTEAYVLESRNQFIETYGKAPDSLEKDLKNYTVEAKYKAKQLERLSNIPDGFIIQEDVDLARSLDATAARELDKRFQAQQAKYNGGIFKDQSDSFKTVANGITTFGTQKPNTPASIFLQQQMRAEYRRRVDIAVAGGADFNTAANTIAQQLANEVRTGARDPESKWYRKPSKPGGGADFPNLNTGNLTATAKASRDFPALTKKIADNGLEAVLDEEGSIITTEEGLAILKNFGKPGFTIPADVMAAATLGKGTDPFTIINRQLRASNLIELEPPQLTRDINSELAPELRQQIYSNINGPNQKMRALDQGAARTDGVKRFQSGTSMRVGSRFRQQFNDTTIQNVLSQLTPSDWDELGYVVSAEAARGTDDEFGVAASVLTRLISGQYGNSIAEIIRAPKQYEAVTIGRAHYEPDLAAKLRSPEGRAKIREFFLMLDGRTDFKGQTMLKNRVPAEDPMFDPSGNFYHYAWQ